MPELINLQERADCAADIISYPHILYFRNRFQTNANQWVRSLAAASLCQPTTQHHLDLRKHLMISVNTPPQTNYPVGHEASQHSKPPRQDSKADTSSDVGTQGDAAAPRPPMTPEQRGQLSSHSTLVNPPQLQKAGSQDETLELVGKNNQLLIDFKAFITECEGKIVKLKNEIVELREQLSAPRKGADEAPIELPQTSQEPVNPVVPDGQTTEVAQGQDLEEALKLNTQLRADISRLMQQMTQAFEALGKELKSMTEHVKTMSTAETRTPTDKSMMTTRDEPADSPSESPTQAAPTSDQFRVDNANIEAGIAEMKSYYSTQISMLEEQVKVLRKHLDEAKQ
ncbi:hypothetical protein [Pseudomonas salomonii]|nr:hypothetical protein [Pseudomonas salomonii]